MDPQPLQQHGDVAPVPTYEEVSQRFQEDKAYNWRENLTVGNYTIAPPRTNKAFISYCNVSEDTTNLPETEEGKSLVKDGLKIHISLPEWNRAQYCNGCNIVIPMLMASGVDFKVIKSRHRMSEQAGQAGKDITVYATRKSMDAAMWQNLIQGITQALVEAGIPPGYRVQGTQKKPEYQINGCNYVTYRYYDEYKKRNVTPAHNHLQDIQINVEGQQAAREFGQANPGAAPAPN